MLEALSEWLHHLFQPHCPTCHENELERKVCRSCETLKEQLEIAAFEKRQLLETIMNLSHPASDVMRIDTAELEPIRPKNVPWRVQREMLEQEDREKAKLLVKESAKVETKLPSNTNKMISVEELEKELGLG